MAQLEVAKKPNESPKPGDSYYAHVLHLVRQLIAGPADATAVANKVRQKMPSLDGKLVQQDCGEGLYWLLEGMLAEDAAKKVSSLF